MSIEVIDIGDIPEGTFDPPEGHPYKLIFRTAEALRRIPPEWYKIVRDPDRIAAVRATYENATGFLKQQAEDNDWGWDAESGRVICILISAF